MSDFGVTVSGGALPWLTRLDLDMQRGTRIRTAMAVQGAKTVRQHFRELDQQRHRSGGTKNFYGGAAAATRHEVDGNAISIVVGNNRVPGTAIAQRFFGGTIKAKPGKALAIPVEGSGADGKRPREFSDLFVVSREAGKTGFLARIGAGGQMQPMYWLRKSVYQEPDTTVLPPAKKLGDDMAEAANRVIRRLSNG